MSSRNPSEPKYPELQTSEQFFNDLIKSCVEGHHTRTDPACVALELWKYVGKSVEIESDMPDDLHGAYVAAYGDSSFPKWSSATMLLTEVYFGVVNHATYAYALSDEGWALLVTNKNLKIKEI